MLTSRDRVNRALNHEITDRPPADLGSTCNTSITKIAYRNLCDFLGYEPDPEPKYLSRDMQVVQVDEPVLERLHIDTRGIQANPPDESASRQLSSDSYKDEWGIVYSAARIGSEVWYYDVVESPLASAGSVQEIEKHKWPNPEDPGRTRGLKKIAQELRKKTPFALVGHMGDTSIFQACCMIRGMESFFIDLIANKPVARALMEKVTEIQTIKMERYLTEVGPYLDVVSVGDDLGGQTGPFISIDLFRKLVKPYLADYFKLIKTKTKARLHLHSCGSIREYLDDLIEIGVDIINPVQISADGMDPVLLKERFGDRISFWGGIDTQRILPRGSVKDVQNEVRRIIGILGEDGGYVLNPVHNIQPDVPPQNIVALFDAAL